MDFQVDHLVAGEIERVLRDGDGGGWFDCDAQYDFVAVGDSSVDASRSVAGGSAVFVDEGSLCAKPLIAAAAKPSPNSTPLTAGTAKR